MGRGELGGRLAGKTPYSVFVTPEARKDYSQMQAAEKPRILKAVKSLKYDAFPQQSGSLSGPFRTYRKLRVGRKIRVIYGVSGTEVTVYAVGQHENFYDRLERGGGRFGRKEAMPTSWRPIVAEPYWLQHDVAISSEGGASGRKQFEIHVGGRPFANRPTLAEAKSAVEERYGPLDWRIVRLPKMEADHYHFGPTTEFTSPTTIWVADLRP